MAGIDKTYTDSYEDYKEFKDWADEQIITFFDGHKECIGDWVWFLTEQDFLERGEIPIMNTPTWMDIYLIQNCKVEFVLDRMAVVYDEEFYNRCKDVDFKAIPEGLEKNRKIKITTYKRTRFPIHSKPYRNSRGRCEWWLQENGNLWYNDETKTWAARTIPYPTNTNTAHLPSLKAVVRHLRKQYLPKGIEFRLCGRYVGEDYLIKIK